MRREMGILNLRTYTLLTRALSRPRPLRERASLEVQLALLGEGLRPRPLTCPWFARGRAALSRKGRGLARMRRGEEIVHLPACANGGSAARNRIGP